MSCTAVSEEISLLLRKSPLRDKINYLSDNPQLGLRRLTTLNAFFCECDFYPNCFGTALFLLGAEKDFLEKLRYEREKNGTFVARSRAEGFAVFPDKFDGPGGLQPGYMQLFLKWKCKELQKAEIGSIVSTCGVGFDGIPLHSAIYLGELDGKGYIFEQDGLRGQFQFSSLEDMTSRGRVNKTIFHSYESQM